MCRPLREQARLPQVICWAEFQAPPQTPCGSELARDGGLSANKFAECAGAFASKLGSYSCSPAGFALPQQSPSTPAQSHSPLASRTGGLIMPAFAFISRLSPLGKYR
ncbi:hypothetical protein C9I49_17980 [Pseudomonas prosekii]|uniref:Uncharacterized protein n=1 Tax=Pseudomonas prosekii TaxID=1148509 RepID=A0A2U2D5A9_9PSED|nr:hypothetical protein C9I49_17980 [Pseudomonas prosekii]